MVLPCGHTYVCSQCTKRLNRCMECREPLFLTGIVQPKASATPAVSSHYNNRGRYSPQPQTPEMSRPGQAEKVMLPIPKNLVLMSMMEAAQRQVRVDQGREAAREDSDDQSTKSSTRNEAEDEDEEYDLDKIISGLATLSGPCGTYAVKADNELCVVALDPRRRNTQVEEDSNHETVNVEPPYPLLAGQTIQVVCFDEGVAKLARGAGYILASHSQLVKGKLQTARLDARGSLMLCNSKLSFLYLQQSLGPEKRPAVSKACSRRFQAGARISNRH